MFRSLLNRTSERKPSSPRRALINLHADLHCGSAVALCPPTVVLDDGQMVHASEEQMWLWENWLDYWGRTFDLAGDRPVVAILAGDACEGIHHNNVQLMSTRVDDHEYIAMQCYYAEMPDGKRIVDKLQALYVIRGTESHASPGAQSEERLARALGAVPESDSRHTFYRLRRSIAGVRFDVAHHRGGSHRPWTRGNPMRIHVRRVIDAYFEADMEPPHIVARAHTHQFEETNETVSRRVKGLGLPAWQLATGYIHRIDPDHLLADIGGWLVECEDGEYKVHRVEYRPDEEANLSFPEHDLE